MRKLVRDYVASQVPEQAKHMFYQEVPYPTHLLPVKLLEEAEEVYNAFFSITDRDENILDELADVLEVIKEIAERRGFTFLQVMTRCVIKRSKKGSLSKGWVYDDES
jgi:predicted house-cleaning noncanonical NTP pyrophosphatase (MazG superfamily)